MATGTIYDAVGNFPSYQDYQAQRQQLATNALQQMLVQNQVNQLPIANQLQAYQVANAGIQNAKANQLMGIIGRIANGDGQAPAASDALGAGAVNGSVGPTVANGNRLSAMQQNGTASPVPGLPGLNYGNMVALKAAGGADLESAFKLGIEGVNHPAGGYVTDVSGNTHYLPKPGEASIDANGHVYVPDGTAQALGQMAGATAQAQEAAKAQFQLLPTSYLQKRPDGSLGPVGGSVGSYLQSLQPAPTAPVAPTSDAPAMTAPINAVPTQPYRTPDGRSGATQADVIADSIAQGQDPTTLKINGAPAFSADMQQQLDAARSGGPAAQAAFAAKVVPLLKGDPQKMAAFAYDLHMPPGTPGHALFGAGGPQTSLPASGTAPAAPSGSVQLAGPADIRAAETTATSAAESGQKYADTLNTTVQEGLAQLRTNNEVLAQIADYQTGIGSSAVRTKVAANLKNMFPDDPRVQAAASAINGGSVVSAQTLHNLVVGAAMRNAISTMQGQGRISQSEVKAFTAAAENPETDPGAFQRIIAIQNKGIGQQVAEQQALTAAIKDGTYNPRTWPATWNKLQYQGLTDPTHANPLFAPATPSPSAPAAQGFKYIGPAQ